MSSGNPIKWGANFDGRGVEFNVFSDTAQGISLLLFRSSRAREPYKILPLEDRGSGRWTLYVKSLKPGALYAYQVSGEWSPEKGLYQGSTQLLLDPYAKAIARYPQSQSGSLNTMAQPVASSGLGLLSGVVSEVPLPALAAVAKAENFNWKRDKRPRTAWANTFIYETHVKGLTYLHPKVRRFQRGKFLGLASKPMLKHFKSLGVTALQLMPVFAHYDEDRLVDVGLCNYWGYNPLNLFTPSARFCCSAKPLEQINEFKEMVRRLHAAGIEVLLDVVYNHTAEGQSQGPLLSWKGFSAASYYRLDEENGHFIDYTGCGNTLNTDAAITQQMVLDSLRYWAEEMHVDGFRFDLASALFRDAEGFNPEHPLLKAIIEDPILKNLKLIAEPWDCTSEGFALGKFPSPFVELNGKYRDDLRRYWRGDPGFKGVLATRIAGSSDLFASRSPLSSVNFICSHDGFTLLDLLSYEKKHNEANQEDNCDGDNNNFSSNCGHEGESNNQQIRELRLVQRLNMLATLFFSAGVPFITAGDELGRTQGGNNNAYCQDNTLSWLNWEKVDSVLFETLCQLSKLRRDFSSLRRDSFYVGSLKKAAVSEAGPMADISWLNFQAEELTEEQWLDSNSPELAVKIAENKKEILLLLNPSNQALSCKLVPGRQWNLLLDTSAGKKLNKPQGSVYQLAARSLVIMLSA